MPITPVALDSSAVIGEALSRLKGKRFNYELYRNYYNGLHRLAFASEKFLNTFGRLFQQFADNLCPAVVDAVDDRLVVSGFGPRGKTGKQAAQKAWDIWQANDMDVRSLEVHQECLKIGDSYVIVWPNPKTGEVAIWPQKGDLMTCQYDDESYDELIWAAKFWLHNRYIRLNLYFPDRIEKYITRSKCTALPDRPQAFDTFVDDTRGETSHIIYHNYGQVPVFHFTNNAPCGSFGLSELRDVIPLQDALNKAVIDMLVAMEFHALPQRYAIGVEVEIDPVTGKPKTTWEPATDRVWTVANPDVKFGEFAAANLGQFINAQSEFRLEIARVSATPHHYIMMTANPPSGEALEAMEERFTKKVIKRQATYGDAWEAVMSFALFINGGRSGAELSTRWKSPAAKSALQESQVQLNKKILGVSVRQLLREMDYTEAEIDQFFEERKVEAAFNQELMPQLGPEGANSSQQFPEAKGGPDETNQPGNSAREDQRLDAGRRANSQ